MWNVFFRALYLLAVAVAGSQIAKAYTVVSLANTSEIGSLITSPLVRWACLRLSQDYIPPAIPVGLKRKTLTHPLVLVNSDGSFPEVAQAWVMRECAGEECFTYQWDHPLLPRKDDLECECMGDSACDLKKCALQGRKGCVTRTTCNFPKEFCGFSEKCEWSEENGKCSSVASPSSASPNS